LVGLLRIDLHPDYLTKRPLRRHHKTRTISEVKRAALGFTFERTLLKRS